MNSAQTAQIRAHYDRLSIFYRWFWGEHIHHGFWINGESPREAQVALVGELARRARVPIGATVLDVGCGLGGSAFWLAHNRGCSVLGITISPVQTRLAQGRARSLGLGKQVQFATADANALDFAPESFDVIWNIECSEHLANKRKFFSDSARLLRRGGSLALSAWVRAGSDDHHELIARICAGMFCPSLGTLEQYRQWMKDGGLSAITTEDVTAQVAKTWDICQQIVERAHLRSILPLISPATNRFVGTFAAMRQAYREGALRYTIFTARKR